jgi:RimJ/RimL family protein N-acetyltransferase
MLDQRHRDERSNGSGRHGAGVGAAATVIPWPPAVGLLDPRHDPRCWGVAGPGGEARRPGPPAGGEDAPPLVVARAHHMYLRTLTRADVALLDEWAADPTLERLVGSDLLRKCHHVFQGSPWFYDACLADPTQIVFMIEGTVGFTRPVGFVRLFDIHVADGYAGLEIIVADGRAQRRGYGVQAGRLIAFYGIDVLGLRRLESKAYAYNQLSINSMLHNGFQQEGVLRKAVFRDGQYWDLVIFGILREELEEQRRREYHERPPTAGGQPA